ncbi:HEXD-like protein [Mya arenaria]|uniref:beta-N-acetylhexosaminidase n=1 Tax=Mya arenaria TaxID=6604 RepID=A0ABY7DJZ0_MYAAR|nr:HEXD-like protein [Mya arenaria]
MALSRTDAHKLVHLDLKGAAPKVEYYHFLLPLLKRFGATGLLIEYEDMFPYSGELQELAQPYAYSKDKICAIQQLAAQNGLIVIPLIQTIGHFEFVLKHNKFHSLCEVPGFPSALCPSNPDSLTALSLMIDQVMALHPAIQHFHVGGDEVYHLGVCERCKEKMALENWTPQQLFFAHMRAVCLYIKEKYPHLTIIMWDDMLRFLEQPVLSESGLGTLVEPMIWHYLPSFLLPPDLWDRLSRVFPNIWVASAFKGATGACVYATNIMYHVDNNLAWLGVLERIKSKFENIRGIAVTGTFNEDTHMSVSHDLKFNCQLPLNPFEGKEVACCEYPGSDIYTQTVEMLRLDTAYEDFLHSEGRLSWMNEYHMRRNFTNPMHMGALLGQALKLFDGLKHLKARFEESLRKVYYQDTVNEWCAVYLDPKIDKMAEIVELAQTQNHGMGIRKRPDMLT